MTAQSVEEQAKAYLAEKGLDTTHGDYEVSLKNLTNSLETFTAEVSSRNHHRHTAGVSINTTQVLDLYAWHSDEEFLKKAKQDNLITKDKLISLAEDTQEFRSHVKTLELHNSKAYGELVNVQREVNTTQKALHDEAKEQGMGAASVKLALLMMKAQKEFIMKHPDIHNSFKEIVKKDYGSLAPRYNVYFETSSQSQGLG